MVQTLIYEDHLVSKISKMTIFDQFAQTIFVDSKQGFIEVEKSFRELNTIKFVRTEIAFELKNHKVVHKKLESNSIIISELMEGSTIVVDKSICRCVSSDLNKLFIQELNRFYSTKKFEFNLFNQSILNKLFKPSTKEDLIDKVLEIGKDMSWAIVPYNLLHIFYDSDRLEFNKDENEKIIYHLGNLNNLEIFINPDDNSGKIFFGNFESIIILANKYMNVYENKQGINYNFEYLFLEQGTIKSLQVK